MSTIELATTLAIGTMLVLAPIDPQPIRDLNTPLPDPEPEPTPEPPKTVLNLDHWGTLWGTSTTPEAESETTHALTEGASIEEWETTTVDGQPLRVLRVTHPKWGTDLRVFT